MEIHTLKEAYFQLTHITIHYVPTDDLWAFEAALEALTEKIQREAANGNQYNPHQRLLFSIREW